MTTDEIEAAFNKVMTACRDLRTFQLMEDELRKIISADYHNGVEDQRVLKW